MYTYIYTYIDIIYIYISGGQKRMAQLLVGHYFKTARKNPTKLPTTFFQHVFNHFVNFQNKCRNDSCFKIGCAKIPYRRYQQYWMCMACTLHGIMLKKRSARLVYGAILSSLSLKIQFKLVYCSIKLLQ